MTQVITRFDAAFFSTCYFAAGLLRKIEKSFAPSNSFIEKESSMTDGQRKNPHEGSTGGPSERRREERFRVPPVYQRYLTLRVKSGDESVPCLLCDFSRSGILFISPTPFEDGFRTGCVISMPSLLTQEVVFSVCVKYCLAKDGSFFIGAEIDSVADQIRFEIFTEIHDYIVQRQDDVY